MFKFLLFLVCACLVGLTVLAFWPFLLIGFILYLIFRRPLCRC